MGRIKLTLIFLYLLLFVNVNAQLVADFSANQQTGCDFEQISFANLSTDGGSGINCLPGFSYSWDFNDPGNPGGSTQCSPGTIFGTPGTYTICLTVTNDATNESTTECKTDYIVIFPLPEPSFTSTPSSGCEPLEVCFQNTTTLSSGNLVSCVWDFGDGTVISDCTTDQICHTYSQDGTYSISLAIGDDNGCPTVTTTNTVDVFAAPDVAIDADQTFSCSPPLTVNFVNNTTPTAGVTFTWTFEGADMPTFVGMTPPPITWSADGAFDVTLVAEGPTGCNDTLFSDNYIGIGSAIDFAPSSHSICLGDTIFFNDLSGGTPLSWNWTFGDGSGTSNQQNPFYVYTAAGCYPVSLMIDNGSCNATLTDPICIDVNEIPTISFDIDNPIGCEIPHTATFTPVGTVPGGTYDWQFGNDTLGTSVAASPTFTFNDYGNHVITLNYISPDGCPVTYQDSIQIEEIVVDLLGSAVEGCVPVTVTLQETTTTLSPINDWVWEIPGIGTFNEESPTVMATDTGEYDVILTVTNDLGCVATDTFEAYIQTGVAQSVDFEADPLLTCIDTVIAFTDLSSPFVDQWFWQFGDGPTSFSFDQNPTHEYLDTGFFEVCLTVFQNGCDNTICKPDYVYLLPPRAVILYEQECANQAFVQFEDNSIAADSIIWDFGVPGTNTDTSTALMPSFTYPVTGSYLVELIAFNFETGCTDTAFQQIVVTDIQAGFTLSDTLGCRPFIVTPEDVSIDALSWEWSSLSGAIVANEFTEFPTFQYNNEGLYPNDIQLIVTDFNGCTDTIISGNIYVNDIVPDFTISQNTGCVPMTVTFTDNSTNTFGNNINWNWNNFAGTSISGTDSQVTMTFTDPDSFDIRLIVQDDLGCQRIIVYNDTIVTTQAIASFNSDTFACTDQPLNFFNMSTGENLNYAWDFGDAGTSTVLNPDHSFAVEGMYNVCLTATDLNGCDSTFCRMITVANNVSDFVADQTFAACPPLLVNFTNLSTNAVLAESEWDFGDGATATGANPAHNYTQAGTFDVTLITTNLSGCRDTIVFDDYIQLEGPQGGFTFSPDEGCAPVIVTVNSTSLSPATHTIDFGDGTLISSGSGVTDTTFVYTYTQAGTFTPELILADDQGCDLPFPGTPITVESLEIDFLATDTLLCDGGLTSFTSIVTSSIPTTFLEWTFEGQVPATSNAANPVNYTYNNNGQYDVTLEVSNGLCTEILTKTDYIDVEPTPVADFTAVPTFGCENTQIVFTDLSSVSSGAITNWDWDFDDTETETVQNPTHIFTTPNTYNVELIVSTINGCRDTTSTPVDIQLTPDITVNPVGVICMGESVLLSALLVTDPAGITYSWNNTGTLSCTDCLSPTASPMVTTTYTITATSLNGCTDQAQVTVEVTPFPVPNIALGLDTAICQGTTIQLLANGGTSDPSSYQWNQQSANLSCYACPNPFANPMTTTTYTVTVTNAGGCSATDAIAVSVFDPTQVFAGPDLTICEGESIVMSDGGFGTNPTWSPVDDLSCAFCPNPTASPNTTTTFAITVNDPTAGCLITDSVTVEVIPSESIDAGEDNLICLGDPTQLTGIGSGTLVWTPGSPLSDPFIANPIANITENTTFYLTATNGNCILVDSVSISVTDSVVISTSDESICQGDSVMLQAVGGNADAYIWTPSDGLSDPTIANPIANVTETTTYTVSASFGSCPSNTATSTVIVNPLPDVSIYPVHNFYLGDAIPLSIEHAAGASSSYAYSWTPSEGLSCDDCQIPLAAPDTNAVYNILITDMESGCETELTTELRELGLCSENVLAVPNGFTPNNDGNNDVLFVRSSAIGNIKVFRVFDRWGAVVFETTDIAIGWDGNFDGKPVNSGVFVYYVEAFCPIDGSVILKKGNVTIIR